ncbi:TVP38/TMEM64 family protein [Terrisporobacter sp.]|uniref:TVP38/TMEM64 family protein n=1 Tax=Terrisporobacter sp. TaxID=1965305 RepID=UPI002610EC49|nr:VTT domain-containing protein [Terrisporobacter sp.]
MKNKKISKIIFFIILIILIMFLNNRYGWSVYLSDTRNLDFIKDIVEENLLLALGIYTLLTVIGCVVLAIPGVTFALFAGLIFGPWLGIFICLIATTIGASLSFIVGRFFLKDTIKPLLEKNKVLKKLLFNDDEKSDLVILMITRMVPIFPYNLQNFAYGITDIGFWKYTIYTFIFMFPGVSFFTIGSAGLSAGDDKWKYFAIAGILAIIVTSTGIFIQKKYLGERK